MADRYRKVLLGGLGVTTCVDKVKDETWLPRSAYRFYSISLLEILPRHPHTKLEQIRLEYHESDNAYDPRRWFGAHDPASY